MVAALVAVLSPVAGGASSYTGGSGGLMSPGTSPAGHPFAIDPGTFLGFCEKWCAILGGGAPGEGDIRHLISALRIAAGLALFLLFWVWILIDRKSVV